MEVAVFSTPKGYGNRVDRRELFVCVGVSSIPFMYILHSNSVGHF